jgi:hypothetical protein
MNIEQIIGFGMVAYLSTAVIFYSLGFNSGKKMGYLKGRINGINIGKQIEKSR